MLWRGASCLFLNVIFFLLTFFLPLPWSYFEYRAALNLVFRPVGFSAAPAVDVGSFSPFPCGGRVPGWSCPGPPSLREHSLQPSPQPAWRTLAETRTLLLLHARTARLGPHAQDHWAPWGGLRGEGRGVSMRCDREPISDLPLDHCFVNYKTT